MAAKTVKINILIVVHHVLLDINFLIKHIVVNYFNFYKMGIVFKIVVFNTSITHLFALVKNILLIYRMFLGLFILY